MRGLVDAVMPLLPGRREGVWHLCADIGLAMVCSLDMRRLAPRAF